MIAVHEAFLARLPFPFGEGSGAVNCLRILQAVEIVIRKEI
jgi:hypothetical protein